jgi:Mycoplasma protein of unknown function, DUF285/BspA type Leucine rich repeat region (6 copies)
VSIHVSEAATYVQAENMWASRNGQWVEVALGGGLPPDWERPAEWLPITVTPGEQKIQALALITDQSESEKVCTLQVTGPYTVDWGDGSAPENFPSNTVAIHTYATANLTPEGRPGVYQALITITPQAGDLTYLSLTNAPIAGKTWISPIVDLVFGPGTIATLILSHSRNLKRVVFQTPVTLTSVANLFEYCSRLARVDGSISTNATSCAYMFRYCYSLEYGPSITATAATLFTAMFQNCGSLREVQSLSLGQPTGVVSMFEGCNLLRELPLFDFSKVTTGTTFARGCVLLASLPAYDYSALSSAIGMYQTCSNLVEVGPLSFPALTNAQQVFSGCASLKRVTALDMPVVTNVSNLFSSCGALEVIPAGINTAAVTTVNAMFLSCFSLRYLWDDFDLSAVSSATNMTNMLNGCLNLRRFVLAPGKGPRFTWILVGMIDGPALDAIYTQLPTVTGQTITVTGVYGGEADTPSIAEAKGWTVTGS